MIAFSYDIAVKTTRPKPNYRGREKTHFHSKKADPKPFKNYPAFFSEKRPTNFLITPPFFLVKGGVIFLELFSGSVISHFVVNLISYQTSLWQIFFHPKYPTMNGNHQPFSLDPERFSAEIDGKSVHLYILKNLNGMQVSIMNLGAKVVQVLVPDREGNPVDVVLGHDSVDDYIVSEEQYFGAVCGRYANRIARGQLTVAGEEYSLPINNGPNTLHGGLKGFNAVVWDVVDYNPGSLHLRYLSKDGEEGFPGNLTVDVIYSLEVENELRISYKAVTDAPTVVNLTNHSYFNLSGEGAPTVHDHILTLNAERHLPTDENAIPFGAPESVEGTPFDFRSPHEIGERIDSDVDQLRWARGYDHTYIIDKPLGEMGLCAVCHSPQTGITMMVHSTEPGVQLYTGNWMSGNMRGKGDSRYPARSAVCFEAQHFPDSPHHPEYPTTELAPDEVYMQVTSYTFGVE